MNMTHDIFCNWVEISDKQYRCSLCNKTITVIDDIDHPPLLVCNQLLTRNKQQSVAENIKRFTEYTSDISTADIINTDQEIQRRYDICQTCSFLINNSCIKCGCVITRDKIMFNKLASQSEHCPINKW